MIIQYKSIYDSHVRQYNHSIFYDWNHDGLIRCIPTDQEVVELISDHFLLDFHIKPNQHISRSVF